jgi:hypothetical protein
MTKFAKYDASMSIVTLTAIYNTYAEKQIKKFSDKKQAIARLDALAATFKPAKVAKAPKGQKIGALICEMLEVRTPRADIIASIAKIFPESAPGRDAKVAAKHVAWYASKMKSQGILA